MGVMQNWEEIPLFPVRACEQVPAPMHAITYMSSPKTGPVPFSHGGLPATPLGPVYILAAAVQNLWGPPHLPPWLQSYPHHHLRRVVTAYAHHRKCAFTHSLLPHPWVSPPKRIKTKIENKTKPTIHGQLSGQIKAESNCLWKAPSASWGAETSICGSQGIPQCQGHLSYCPFSR